MISVGVRRRAEVLLSGFERVILGSGHVEISVGRHTAGRGEHTSPVVIASALTILVASSAVNGPHPVA